MRPAERIAAAALRRVDREVARRGRPADVTIPGYRSAAELAALPGRAVTFREWREAVALLRAALAERGIPLRVVYLDGPPRRTSAARAEAAARAGDRRLGIVLEEQVYRAEGHKPHRDWGIGWALLDGATQTGPARSGEDDL